MDTRPIGVFDSGLGGLTAVRQLRRLMPSENIIYFGDTARVPYGNRSRETLLQYARQDMRFLSGFDLKAVVIACGTISTNCLEELQAESGLPVIGVVDPACRRAAALSGTGRVGLAATRASVASGAYERTFRRLDQGEPAELMAAATAGQIEAFGGSGIVDQMVKDFCRITGNRFPISEEEYLKMYLSSLLSYG